MFSGCKWKYLFHRGLLVPLTFPHLLTGVFPALLEGVQSHGSAPLLAIGKRDLQSSSTPTVTKEAAVEIVFDFSTRKKWLPRGTKPTYNKRAALIYFGFPSIPFFPQKFAKSCLLIASIVSGKNCFWMTSISFNRKLLICGHGVAFPMSEFRSQLVRKFAQQILSNPQGHVIIILKSRKQC